jgi:hypothetical protein
MHDRTLRLARHRARLRKKSGGAAMFIVAITLALLAAMGVYGLTATARDIQAAGDSRMNVQLQHTAVGAFMSAAETIVSSGTGGTTDGIVNTMTGGAGYQSNAPPYGASACRSTKPYSGNAAFKNAEACTVLDMQHMASIASGSNALIPPPSPFCANCPHLNSDSWGGIPQQPNFWIEVTNPRPIGCPPGNDSQQNICKELTLTVYMNAVPGAGLAPTSVVVGRGRLHVVGNPR